VLATQSNPVAWRERAPKWIFGQFAAVGGGCVAGQARLSRYWRGPAWRELTADQAERYEEEATSCSRSFSTTRPGAGARRNEQKVDQMAADLLAGGLITDPLIDEPFRTDSRVSSTPRRREFLAYDVAGAIDFLATSC